MSQINVLQVVKRVPRFRINVLQVVYRQRMTHM